ncbi:isopeptide-forming domain-containing fimbrial protein [Stackebrandtia soli]|uniref:isopeptide-forming domain-containing fimbrial protein n=1 Tax=Stackebrandtia soli TaxID=1892856 RepID=UPI0039ED52A4
MKYRGLVAIALISGAISPGPAFAEPEDCAPARAKLENGGFEEPFLGGSIKKVSADDIPPWRTTAADNLIEVWGPGNEWANRGTEVEAASGRQFVELNANVASALYQDISTTPNTTVYWGLEHRARDQTAGDDIDTMNVVAGPPGGPYVELGEFADGEHSWTQHLGSYEAPAGQTVTRFGFNAVDTGAGDPTIGNFLDGIEFGDPACLSISKDADPRPGSSVQPGDHIDYTITVANVGGNSSNDTAITDTIPEGATYLPGSATIDGSTQTDSTDGDRAEYDPSTRALTFRVGDGAGPTDEGTVAVGDTVSVGFTVEVDDIGTVISNRATVTYLLPLLAQQVSTKSAEVRHDVVVPPHLAVTGNGLESWIAVGAALVATGAIGVFVTRRRSGHSVMT